MCNIRLRSLFSVQIGKIFFAFTLCMSLNIYGQKKPIVSKKQLVSVLEERGFSNFMTATNSHGWTLFLGRPFSGDLSRLKGLGITSLQMSGCRIASISGVESLDSLEELDVSDNSIEDVRNLRGLPLVRVDICDTRIDDISPFVQSELRELKMWGTCVEDVSCLTNTSLETLELGVMAVSNFSCLARCPIKRLSFMQRPGMLLRDISSLRLEHLTIYNLKQDDMVFLANMPLEVLEIKESSVDDLTVIKKLPLKRLLVDSDRLSNIQGIENMPLHSLSLFAPDIKEVPDFLGMQLTNLSLFCGEIDATPLHGLRLYSISFDPDKITNGINVLREMPTLKEVGLSLGFRDLVYFKASNFWHEVYDEKRR